jgi:hypothetical protein
MIIKWNLKEIGWDAVDWINLAQIGTSKLALGIMVMNRGVPYNVENFLTKRGTRSFSRMNLLFELVFWDTNSRISGTDSCVLFSLPL